MTDINISETIARLRHDLELEGPTVFAMEALRYSPSERLTVAQMTDLLDAAEAGARARDAALEEAAALIEPGPSPCDCITMLDEWHVARCDCSNVGDTERAAEWCADKNHANRIRALKGRTA